jgi:hypothetical protein
MVVQTVMRQMVGWLMNDELKRIWKESVVVESQETAVG